MSDFVIKLIEGLQDRYEFGVISKLKSPFGSLANCTFGEGDDQCLDQLSVTV